MKVQTINTGYVTRCLCEVVNGEYKILTNSGYSIDGFKFMVNKGVRFMWAKVYCEVDEVHNMYKLIGNCAIPTELEDLPYLQEQSKFNLSNGRYGREMEGHEEVMKKYNNE